MTDKEKYLNLVTVTNTARHRLVSACDKVYLECHHIQEAVKIVEDTIAEKNAEIAELKSKVADAKWRLSNKEWVPGSMK